MIKFVVDSSAELDKEFCEKNNIILLPNDVIFGDEVFVAGVTITNQEFYRKLRERTVVPKTALINQHRFEKVFNEAKNAGDELIVMPISSKMSSSYNAAVLAKQEVGYNKIYVLDHLTVTIAQTALIFEGLKLRDAGLSGEQITAKLMELKNKIKLYAAVESLKYLRQGGRLSGTAAVVGTMLNIKPIIELTDGLIFSNYKCMGFKKAEQKLIDLVKQDGFDPNYPIYVAHTDDLDEAKEFHGVFKEQVSNFIDGGIYEIGSVVGTHAGPGCVAVIFFRK